MIHECTPFLVRERPYDLDFVLESMAAIQTRAFDDWLSNVMAKQIDPGLFIRAYGNATCKRDVGMELERLGFLLVYHPNGTIDVCRHDEVIATYTKEVC